MAGPQARAVTGVRFAHRGDIDVAYQVHGDRPVDLVYVEGRYTQRRRIRARSIPSVGLSLVEARSMRVRKLKRNSTLGVPFDQMWVVC